MINLCCIVGIVSNKEVDTAAVGKEAKLRKWSTIINPIIDETGATSWHLNGKRHREDGPAIEDADGSKQWYLNGKLHTEEEFNSLCPKRT